MQIVIDIPQGRYEDILSGKEFTVYQCDIRDVLKNGTPLPKGHGRLIDADSLEKKMCDREEELGDDRALWESSAVSTALDMFAPTIIEADKQTSGCSSCSHNATCYDAYTEQSQYCGLNNKGVEE